MKQLIENIIYMFSLNNLIDIMRIKKKTIETCFQFIQQMINRFYIQKFINVFKLFVLYKH